MPSKLKAHIKPHFMVTRYRRQNQRSYKSKTILGQLYDAVKEVDFVPIVHLPFDKRLLSACPRLTAEMRNQVLEMKAEYDASMRRIMAQHGIATEFEVWTAFVLGHNGLTNDYMFPQELGRIVASLRERFQEAVFEKCGGRDFSLIAPFVAAMYAVTAEETEDTIQQLRMARLSVTAEALSDTDIQGGMKIEAKDLPLLSFPWLFHRELGMIANGERLGQSDTIEAEASSVPEIAFAGADPSNIVTVAQTLGNVETSEGVTHKGEVLKLFEHPSSSGRDEEDEIGSLGGEDHDMSDNWLDAFTDTSHQSTLR